MLVWNSVVIILGVLLVGLSVVSMWILCDWGVSVLVMFVFGVWLGDVLVFNGGGLII